MVAVLSEQEKEDFAKVLQLQAYQEKSEWFIEDDGPIINTMKVVEALCDGKRVYLRPR